MRDVKVAQFYDERTRVLEGVRLDWSQWPARDCDDLAAFDIHSRPISSLTVVAGVMFCDSWLVGF